MEFLNRKKFQRNFSPKVMYKLGDLDRTSAKILAWDQSRSTKDKQGFEYINKTTNLSFWENFQASDIFPK